jgi:HTH-type transcriptional regulator / antitoxin HigA
MQIQLIRTDEDHRAALTEIETLWGAPEGTDDGDRLEALIALVESYEARRWPLVVDASFDPVDVLQFAVHELGHDSEAWKIPPALLIRPYKTTKAA